MFVNFVCFLITAPVEWVDTELVNSSTIAVSWEPLSSLPGWSISYYQVEVTSLTTHTPSHVVHAHTEKTTAGNETSLIIVSDALFVSDGVELVTRVRAVLDVGVDGVGVVEGEGAVHRMTLEPGVF